ncbi:MAG: ferritin [Calditrichia bacterium]
MPEKDVLDALNKQVAMEEYASRSYMSLGLWADQEGFEGTARFFYAQAEEEREHMKKIIKFILSVGGKPVISNYEERIPAGDSFKGLFETGLSHEEKVTRSIHKIVESAWGKKDYATFNFLQWFVEEQVEEEDMFRTILDKVNIIDEHGGSYYMLDRELARRAGE